jgi:hypothetical protein
LPVLWQLQDTPLQDVFRAFEGVKIFLDMTHLNDDFITIHLRQPPLMLGSGLRENLG